MASQQNSSNQDKKKIPADRIVFPDDNRDVKAEMAEAAQEIKSNSIEEEKVPADKVVIQNRNFIQTPPNCPPGQQPDKDGICRDAF